MWHSYLDSSIERKWNDWMVRNFISREANVFLKIYKTLITSLLEYCTKTWPPMSRHENWIFDGDISQEGVYLIDVAGWFGYCNRWCTIEQLGNRNDTGRIFVLTLDVRRHSRSNLQSSLLRCGTRPNECGTQLDSNSLVSVC